MVAAAEKLLVAGSFAHDVAAMGAYVAHQVHLVLAVAGEHNRLVERAFKDGEGMYRPRHLYQVVVPYELPAWREQYFDRGPVKDGIDVEALREGGGFFDYGIDVHVVLDQKRRILY